MNNTTPRIRQSRAGSRAANFAPMRRVGISLRGMFALLALVALAGVAAVLTIGGSSTSPSASRLASKSAFHSDGVLSPPRAAPPLVLDNYLGRPVNIDAYRG